MQFYIRVANTQHKFTGPAVAGMQGGDYFP